MCIITGLTIGIGTAIASSFGATVAAAGATAAGASVITATTAGVIGTAAIGSVAAGIVGTALGVVGSVQQGNAAAAAYEYQAQVAQQNSRIAQNNAAMERQAGLEEARRQRIKTILAIGQQKVGMAAGGVDIATGTPLDALEDTATMGELDALMLQHDAEKRAVNYEIDAANFSNQSNLDMFSSSNSRKSGYMNAAASGLKGVSSTIGSISDLGGFGRSTGSQL